MICPKCNNAFPNWIMIDGKKRNLQHRKFCLDCSPFKKHNTKDLTKFHANPIYTIGRICPACKKTYKGKGLLCAACESLRKRTALKEKAVEYKGGKCSSCGYNKCIANLVFHHLDPSKKDFIISDGAQRTFTNIRAELDKCIILCHNCHNELHWNETATRRNIIKTMYK